MFRHFFTVWFYFTVPYMFIQNKKPFAFASFPFSLIQAIISNYENHVHESVIYSWRASMKSFSFPNVFWNFLSSWRKSGNCLCNMDSGSSSSAAGSVLQEERSPGKSSIGRLSAAPALSGCSWIIKQCCPSTCPSILSPLRVTGIWWSRWNMRNPSCVSCPDASLLYVFRDQLRM